MMRYQLLAIAAIVLLAVQATWAAPPTQPASAPANPEAMRKELEASYAKLRSALATGEEAKVKQALSAWSYPHERNRAYSRGLGPGPNTWADLARFAADPSKFKFVSVLQNGPTARLGYVRDAEYPAGSVNILLVRFVQEQGVWKVDVAYLCSTPRTSRGKEVSPDDEYISKACPVDGVIRPAEALLPKPDYAVQYAFDCRGYDAKLLVNGVQVPPTGGVDYLPGGLKKGENTVQILGRPSGTDERRLELRIFTTDKRDPLRTNDLFSAKPMIDGDKPYEAKFTMP